MSLPQMEKKILIEKKISENGQQNQTRIDTGEADGENWPPRKLYIPESELTLVDNIKNWQTQDGDGKLDSNRDKIKLASKLGQSQEDSNGQQVTAPSPGAPTSWLDRKKDRPWRCR